MDIIISDKIKSKIYTLRGIQVMLDSDLTELYGVNLKRLNEQVKRNIERFPENFMFQLTEEEYNSLRSQFVTSNGEVPKLSVIAFNEEVLRCQNGTLNKESLRSQFATLNKTLKSQKDISNRGKHKKYLPYAFTEQGVAMLSWIQRRFTYG